MNIERLVLPGCSKSDFELATSPPHTIKRRETRLIRVRQFVITFDTQHTSPSQPSRELGRAVAHDSARTLARDSQPHSRVAPQQISSSHNSGLRVLARHSSAVAVPAELLRRPRQLIHGCDRTDRSPQESQPHLVLRFAGLWYMLQTKKNHTRH